MELTHACHSIYSLNYHLVLVIAYRKKVLTKPVMKRLIEITTNITNGLKVQITEANGEKDHIHFLLSAPPDFNLCRMINSIKTVTSRRLKQEFPEIQKKLWSQKFWTASYYVTTVGDVSLETIQNYIESQGT